jgi:hypothetical protein
LAPDFLTPDFFDPNEEINPLDLALDEIRPIGPSLPVILFSAACGIGSGIIGLYLAYRVLLFTLPVSAGLATLCMLAMLGGVAAGLSAVTRSNGMANIAFSCGLVMVTVLFFAFCSLLGAFAATMLLRLQ